MQCHCCFHHFCFSWEPLSIHISNLVFQSFFAMFVQKKDMFGNKDASWHIRLNYTVIKLKIFLLIKFQWKTLDHVLFLFCSYSAEVTPIELFLQPQWETFLIFCPISPNLWSPSSHQYRATTELFFQSGYSRQWWDTIGTVLVSSLKQIT